MEKHLVDTSLLNVAEISVSYSQKISEVQATMLMCSLKVAKLHRSHKHPCYITDKRYFSILIIF